jgi:uncharacterized membrane protein
MNAELNNWLQLIFRWVHVVAGITWIGLLYFFNWVNAGFAKTLTADNKKAVVPELIPRALYFFRWGAAWTWVTGALLAGLVYYHGNIVFENPEQGGNAGLWFVIFLVGLAVGYGIYNAVMKGVKNVIAANAISLVLFAAFYALLECVGRFGGRALYIHAGMIFGTTMALNVWMIIWPYQKRIITATKNGTAPDATDVATAGLRSRHNTFMSVPLVFAMISNHYPTVYGASPLVRDLILVAIIAVGFIAVRWLYGKSTRVTGF